MSGELNLIFQTFYFVQKLFLYISPGILLSILLQIALLWQAPKDKK